MSLSGTHIKKEPLVGKDSDEVTISALCSFLYIVDITTIFFQVIEEMMHKKLTFYTYVNLYKKLPICEKYDENSLFHTSNMYELY